MARDRSLTEDSVLAEARERSGLHELGDDHFLRPLRLLLEGVRGIPGKGAIAAQLVARTALVHLVENRLRIHDALTREPAILERPLRRPIVVVGLPRTATTLLHGLLALDPDARALRFYETLSPVPREGAAEAERIGRAEILVRMADRLSPGLARAHRLDARGPEECLGLLMNTFVTPFFSAVAERGLLPYRMWLETLGDGDRDRSYREYRQQLQIVQSTDGRRWALKCPCHMFGLSSLLRVLPEAAVVHTHRDLASALPSLCSLRALTSGFTGEAVDGARIGNATVRFVDDLLRWSMKARDSEHAHRILDVRFDDVVADPVEAVRGIYHHFGYPVTPEFLGAMGSHLDASAEAGREEHRYSLEEFGLEEDRIRKDFGWYHDRFRLGG